MSNEISAEQINSIMAVLNNAGTEAVESYSRWHFVNAVVWLLVGVALLTIVGTAWANRKKIAEKVTDDDSQFWLVAACVIAAFFGLLFVGCNLTNLFEPTAYGIHQLIIDIRG